MNSFEELSLRLDRQCMSPIITDLCVNTCTFWVNYFRNRNHASRDAKDTRAQYNRVRRRRRRHAEASEHRRRLPSPILAWVILYSVSYNAIPRSDSAGWQLKEGLIYRHSSTSDLRRGGRVRGPWNSPTRNVPAGLRSRSELEKLPR